MGFGVFGLEPDRRAVFGGCLTQLPLGLQGVTEVVVGLGVVGLEPDRLAERGLRGRVVVLDVAKGVTEVGVGLGVVGLEPDRLAEFGDRLVELPLGLSGRRRGCSGPRRSRASEPDRRCRRVPLAAMRPSLELPLAPHGVAEVVMGLGVIRLEPDRLAERGLRGRVVVLDVAKGGAEDGVDLGEVGFEPDRLVAGGDGPVEDRRGVDGAAALLQVGSPGSPGDAGCRAVDSSGRGRPLQPRRRGPCVRAGGPARGPSRGGGRGPPCSTARPPRGPRGAGCPGPGPGSS